MPIVAIDCYILLLFHSILLFASMLLLLAEVPSLIYSIRTHSEKLASNTWWGHGYSLIFSFAPRGYSYSRREGKLS